MIGRFKRFLIRSSRRRRVCFVALATFLLLAVIFVGYCAYFRGRLLPRLYVGQVPVGGLSSLEAVAKITDAENALKQWSVTVDDEDPVIIDISSLAVFDVEGTVIAAQNYTRGDNGWQWFVRRLKSMFVRQSAAVVVAVDAATLRERLAEVLYNQLDNQAQEVSLAVRSGRVSIVEGRAGEIVDRAAVESAVLTNIFSLSAEPLTVGRVPFEPEFTASDGDFARRQAERVIGAALELNWPGGAIGADQATLAKFLKVSGADVADDRYAPALAAGALAADRLLLLDIDRDKVVAWLTQIKNQIERAPQNAEVAFEDGQVRLTAAGQDGLQLDVDATAIAWRSALLARANGQSVATVAAIVTATPPAVSSSNIRDLGITELIGRAASDYSGSAENRRKNIALGVGKMSGFILLPGEEWSSLKAIGPVDAAHGFLPEKVILSNKLELQYGGGLCQPISTLFRAILDAGLPITERQNHSRRVSYYEKPSAVKGVHINWDAAYANIGNSLVGYDATVYEPHPDLRFKNDTAAAVLVQAFVTNDRSVTFELYGTNDGRQVSASRADVLYTKHPTEPVYEDDPTLPAGTEQQVEKPIPGAKTSFTYQVAYADGRVESRNFVSIYKPVSARYLRGTAPAPAAPEPAPDPASAPVDAAAAGQ